MTVIINSVCAKRAYLLALFLMYVSFAIYLFINSLYSKGDLSVFFKDATVRSLYLAGAVDVSLAFFTGFIVSLTFGFRTGLGTRWFGGKSHKGIFNHSGDSGVLGVFIGIILFFYLVVILRFFSELTLLFFCLVILFFIKNFAYIILGRKKEIIIKRFNEVYLIAILAVIVPFILWVVIAIVLGIPAELLKHFEQFKFLPWAIMGIFGLLILNSISIYYLLHAWANISKFVETSKE